jgi:hypothetical protein
MKRILENGINNEMSLCSSEKTVVWLKGYFKEIILTMDSNADDYLGSDYYCSYVGT